MILFIVVAGFPPFQQPMSNDWWFNKLSSQKHLFWSAHSRLAYFSDQFQDLINKMLCIDPEKRITLDAVRRHPWFTGLTLTPGALHAEMMRRHSQVNAEKQRERLEKERHRAQDRSLGEDACRSGGDTLVYSEPVLAVDPNSDDLPPSAPGWMLFELPQIQATPVKSSLDRFQSLHLSSEAPSASSQAPAMESEQLGLTHFAVDLSESAARSQLESALRSLQGSIIERQDWKLQASFASRGVELTASVCRCGQSVEVVVKRLSGDASVFRHIYAALMSQLA